MAKTVRVSDDNGVTWYTLPGNSAELSNEGGEVEDTIFGQDFGSAEIGLIGWQITANALYKGFAGYVAKILKAGTPTPVTGETMSLETGQIYQIDDTAKQIFDRSTSIVVYDNAIDETANVEWIDYLFGRVKFLDAHTVAGPVTIDVTYMPTAAIGTANEFTLTQTAEAIDNTDFATAQANSGRRTFTGGLKTVNLELSGIYSTSNDFLADLGLRNEIIVEINPDGSDKSEARGFFKYLTHSQSGDVGALEDENVTMRLTVPDESLLLVPFKWVHGPTTTLNQSIQVLLAAWENNTPIDSQYLHDGVNGQTGDTVVTEVTLAGGLEVMNEFSCTLQGSGVLTPVP